MMFRHLILSFVLLANPALATRAQLPAAAFPVAQAAALNPPFDPSYKLKFQNAVQDKNFYLLSLFQRDPAVRRILRQSPVLKKLANVQRQNLRMAASCNDVECYDRLFRLSGPTIEMVARELAVLARQPAFKRLAAKDLRPSGTFIRYNPQSDSELFVAAWKDAGNGLNRLLRVYCLGKDPYYKDIDRVSFDVASDEYRKLLKTKTAAIKVSRDSLFFEPALSFALKLLEANRRDEAGRYEPLEEGENKSSLQNLENIKWNDYPYSFILVLGSGSHDSARMSKIGMKRTDQAAQLFSEHKAPLIILSGGNVHPMQTPYNEAMEMKNYLMERFKIPEQSILIEPHARHTTTNFRNAARLVFRYQIPLSPKGLVTSSEDHIALVTKEGFRIRCTTELGYFPIESINRISPVTAEFTPSVASLFFDVNDPLDP
jgi:DUF218 domain